MGPTSCKKGNKVQKGEEQTEFDKVMNSMRIEEERNRMMTQKMQQR
jgi:hypothetical protein